ncbi:MAG: SURF1 family cytochrome oxidase biogenesis protein [Pseudomonadota bacterium]
MSFRPFPIMTACVIPALAVLALLGNWQWQRYGAKAATIDAVIEWTTFSGQLAVPQSFYVSTLLDGDPAWRLVNVIENGNRISLVSRRLFISIGPPDANPVAVSDLETTEGIFVEPSSPTRWTPKSDGTVFYAYDVDGIRNELAGSPAETLTNDVFEPRLISVVDLENGRETALIENPWANPALADPLPPARHLGYALTWWGIALGLIVIYFVFHLQSGRLTLRQAA